MLMVPYEPAEAELRVANSRFIARLAPAATVEEAKDFIASVRRAHADATHNVPAFIIGGGNTVTEFCSDDGEPAGTSGRPLLATLKGSGLGNVVVVVTRYFGGTLLGTGGLVKAYTEAGKAVLAKTRRAVVVPTHRLALELPYHLYERTTQLLGAAGGSVVGETFAEEVRLDVDLSVEAYASFAVAMAELSGGRVSPLIESTRLAARMVEEKAEESRSQ